jgi:hypothetical protein
MAGGEWFKSAYESGVIYGEFTAILGFGSLQVGFDFALNGPGNIAADPRRCAEATAPINVKASPRSIQLWPCQNRTENPMPVKKSSGRPLKPKPARTSICVFGVGW